MDESEFKECIFGALLLKRARGLSGILCIGRDLMVGVLMALVASLRVLLTNEQQTTSVVSTGTSG